MVTFSQFDYVKMAYSVALVIFSIIIVTALMFQGDTQVASKASPIVAFIVMWVCILWMSMVEGGQCSMVGLPPIDRELYKDSHPITYKICSLGHKGDNLDRYLMGRQFMVIFINFTISLCGAPLSGATVLGLPDWLHAIFLGSGIAMVLTNVNIGQLTAQCNASHCMLDYINTHFMTFTLYTTLAIEMTGVMHCSYLIRDCFYWAAGKPVETNEPPRDTVKSIFHWGRVLFSLFVLSFAIAVSFEALFSGKTALWEGVPEAVGIILCVLFMCVVGMLEGMQIAFFVVSKLPANERGSHPMAMRTCEMLFKGEGRNLPGFMVGRQMTVTLCFFVIARILSINVDLDDPTSENIFGVSDPVQKFFNMGFLGAIITTILASISWQLVAGAFPLQFLSNPLVFVLLNCALFLEWTGICHASWFFGMIHKKVAGFQLDEVYVGTAEERAAQGHADDDSACSHAHLGTAGFVKEENVEEVQPPEFDDRKTMETTIAMLQEQIKLSSNPVERQCLMDALRFEQLALDRLQEARKVAMPKELKEQFKEKENIHESLELLRQQSDLSTNQEEKDILEHSIRLEEQQYAKLKGDADKLNLDIERDF